MPITQKRALYKRPIRSPSDHKYHIGDKKYIHLMGTRKQVWIESAYKTTGGLTRSDLHKNKSGEIVSKSKHDFESSYGRLRKAGWGTKRDKNGKPMFGACRLKGFRHSKKQSPRPLRRSERIAAKKPK